MDKFIPIHKHFIATSVIDMATSPMTLKNSKSERLLTKAGKDFLLDLVARVGMNPVTKPQAVYVKDLGNEGLTGSINLSTSHAAFHLWDNTGLLQLDLYSCKSFEEDLVLSAISSHFGKVLKQYSITIDRSLPTDDAELKGEAQ